MSATRPIGTTRGRRRATARQLHWLGGTALGVLLLLAWQFLPGLTGTPS